jgi:hypothetical protein
MGAILAGGMAIAGFYWFVCNCIAFRVMGLVTRVAPFDYAFVFFLRVCLGCSARLSVSPIARPW